MPAKIAVADLIGSRYGVASDDGARLYEAIHKHLSFNEDVEVSFVGITRLTTAFLNAAIGQAYNEFSEDFIRNHLKVSDLDEQGLSLVQRVVSRAKIFFSSRRTQ